MPSKKQLRARLYEVESNRDGWRNAFEKRDRDLADLQTATRDLTGFLADCVLDAGVLSTVEEGALRDRVRKVMDLDDGTPWTVERLRELRDEFWSTTANAVHQPAKDQSGTGKPWGYQEWWTAVGDTGAMDDDPIKRAAQRISDLARYTAPFDDADSERRPRKPVHRIPGGPLKARPVIDRELYVAAEEGLRPLSADMRQAVRMALRAI